MKRDTEESIPRKKAVNPKAKAAKSRKSTAEANRKNREDREKEEEMWRDAEGEPKSRGAAQKSEEAAKKQAEAAARKAMTRKLAEQEEKELEKFSSKPAKKVTEAELRRMKEEQQNAVAEKLQKQSRIAEKEYEKMVMVPNTNIHDESVLEASSIDEAIAQMANVKLGEENVKVMMKKHPETKMIKAAEQGKKGNSLTRLARDDDERSLLRDVRRINLDRSGLDCYDDYEDAEEFEEEEDSYQEDGFQEYEEKYYNY